MVNLLLVLVMIDTLVHYTRVYQFDNVMDSFQYVI